MRLKNKTVYCFLKWQIFWAVTKSTYWPQRKDNFVHRGLLPRRRDSDLSNHQCEWIQGRESSVVSQTKMSTYWRDSNNKLQYMMPLVGSKTVEKTLIESRWFVNLTLHSRKKRNKNWVVLPVAAPFTQPWCKRRAATPTRISIVCISDHWQTTKTSCPKMIRTAKATQGQIVQPHQANCKKMIRIPYRRSNKCSQLVMRNLWSCVTVMQHSRRKSDCNQKFCRLSDKVWHKVVKETRSCSQSR